MRGSRSSAAPAITAVALVIAVAACGSSSSGTNGVGSEHAATPIGTDTVKGSEYKATTKTSSGSETQQTTSPSVHVPGCRSVPAPASRAGEQAPRPTAQLDPARSYSVRLVTNCGTIVVQLAVKEAPKTASSFAHLVELDYYNGLTFHRVVPDFVIQGGDPNGNGSGGPSWTIVEPPPATLRYTMGVVAMAKTPTAPSGSSGSQFFIVTGSNVNLPPVYALIGRVVSGERAVQAIAHAPTEGSTPRAPMVIERATLTVH
jgi:cyclophilin family peptidyl-prolyl cis-trans isomerase